MNVYETTRRRLPPSQVRRMALAGELRASGPVGRIAIWFALCGLTAREEQVAWQLIAGRTIPEIAETLFVEHHTVKNIAVGVYRKCGTASALTCGRNASRTRLLVQARAIGSRDNDGG